MRLRHVGIVTQQADKLKAFYEKQGFTISYDGVEKVRIIKLKDDKGGMIELLQYESQGESTLRKLGISHIAFTQDPDGTNLEIVQESKDAFDK